MEAMNVALPPALMYDSAESRAILSTRRTISIKPTTGTSVGNSSTTASTSDIVQFKLPNSGVLANCYLRYTINGAITAGADATDSFAADNLVCDPYAPSAAPIRRLVVASSDGTEITNVNNYHSYCSLMARYKNSKEWSETYGANQEGCPGEIVYDDLDHVAKNNTALDGNAQAANAVGVGFHKDFEMNAKRLNRNWVGDNTLVHKFQAGILDQKNEAMLPLALLGSGMNLYLHLADKDEVFRATPNQSSAGVAGSALDCHPAVGAAVSNYHLKDVELVCDLIFYPPEVMASIQEKLCGGLKVRCDRIRTQTNAVSQESNVVILNEHARSVNSVFFGITNKNDKNNGRREQNEYYKIGKAGASAVKEFQLQVGSENVPTNPCKFGSQSWVELEKAMKAVYDEDFKFGNQISQQAYNKTHNADSANPGSGGAGATPGSAIMGLNLKSHPEIPSIMSGKSASSGSIPISLTLDYDGSTNLGDNELQSWVVSDQIVEFLADGSALVHK